jgi:hypothetical protein
MKNNLKAPTDGSAGTNEQNSPDFVLLEEPSMESLHEVLHWLDQLEISNSLILRCFAKCASQALYGIGAYVTGQNSPSLETLN